MTITSTHSYPYSPEDIPTGYSQEEWAARVDLAACYPIFARLGWNELIYNHITLRLPGPEKHFLINPLV
ncbi:hypothetical protein L390_01739 [Klebsiella quasipneumoniae subsp. similipneumoniae]|nr:class II aldolase/adducin family protein [Klebsiella quasipneumoniae]ESM63051.1 hypothetical protein L390_01739 [Klebsiella quasipneumoniae subsp. similipneumoniae]